MNRATVMTAFPHACDGIKCSEWHGQVAAWPWLTSLSANIVARRKRINRFLAVAVIFHASLVLAGARIDLRPTPPPPPDGYQPNTIVRVDAYLVDTGNLQGDIPFRGIFLDLSDSPPWGGAPGTLTYPDPDGPGPLGANQFEWRYPVGIENWNYLPHTSWVYPLGMPIPGFQITMPNNGEVRIGNLNVNLGTVGGTLDVMNDDIADANFGARTDFGFGGPGDPVTTWRAFTGELTGGVLELPVIPEPTSMILLTLAAAGLLTRWRHRL